MKKFKRIAAAAAASVMVFSLAGCGSKDEGVVADAVKELEKTVEEVDTLNGDWVSDKVNLVETLAEQVDAQMNESSGTEVKTLDYITDFSLISYLTFNEDGTYYVDYEFVSDKDVLRSEFAEYMWAVLEDVTGQELEYDDLTEILGMTLDEYTEETWSEEKIMGMFPEELISGEYTNEDGVITLYDDEGEVFGTGTLDGETLVTTDNVLGDAVFTKA